MITGMEEISASVAEEYSTGKPFTSPPAIDPTLDTPPDPDESLDSDRGYIFSNRVRFAWKHDDEELLIRIRKSADHLFSDLFADAVDTIDRLYGAMRVRFPAVAISEPSEPILSATSGVPSLR